MKRSFQLQPILAAAVHLTGCKLSSKTAFASDGLDPVNKVAGLALEGYDAVAYFQQSKPVERLVQVHYGHLNL